MRSEPLVDQVLHAFLLVEDHPLFIHGFRSAIERLFPHARLDIATTGPDAQALMLAEAYDLVFLDLHIPEISGFRLLETLQQRQAVQPVVIITGQVDSIIVEKARRLGALGAISKRIDLKRLSSLCEKLLEGQTVFDEGNEWTEIPITEEGKHFTGRELEVLRLLAEGLENAQIGARLNMSDSTLKTHLRSLFFKMNVNNRTACVMKALRAGWI